MTKPLVARTLFDWRCRVRRGVTTRVGLTLIEVLVALAITLLMMGAVLTVFANVTGSITRRRATIELSGAMRHVRETLSRDLEGATCPAVPWQRPESNHGYLEIIEGRLSDSYPSIWLWDSDDNDQGAPDGLRQAFGETPGIDLELSSLPGSNLRGPSRSTDEEGRGLALGSNEELSEGSETDGRGLGDGDDILMLTVRNDLKPFVGRIPSRTQGPNDRPYADWQFEEIEAPLAEVIWFSLENPPERDDAQTFAFGEAGFRTIYRRALLIAPWLNYEIRLGTGSNAQVAGPGVVRVLPASIDRDNRNDYASALAALVSFQDQYDLSVRLEWDPLLGDDGRWVLKANSLADLTKRENRYEHHGLIPNPDGLTLGRNYPFSAASSGWYKDRGSVVFVNDPELTGPSNPPRFISVGFSTGGNSVVVAYEPRSGETRRDITSADRRYGARPFVYLSGEGDLPATARAVLDENGNVVHVTRGLAPLGGSRRGEDVMVSDALAFDLRVYDPGAPLYAYYPNGQTDVRADLIVAPGDPAWVFAYAQDVGTNTSNPGTVGTATATNANSPFQFERLGAYVDLGYGRSPLIRTGSDEGRLLQFTGITEVVAPFQDGLVPSSASFLEYGEIAATNGNFLTTGYSFYDTWSWSYENNGVDEDLDGLRDEGTNSFDNPGLYDIDLDPTTPLAADTLYGPDDAGERETRPPYASALRGMQVKLRAYERDSLQVIETTVRESFVPE